MSEITATNHGTSNITLIPDTVIRQLALQTGIEYNEAIFLVGKANAARNFLELDALVHFLPQEHCRYKKKFLIGIQHTLQILTGASVATAFYFRTVSDKDKVNKDSDGDAKGLLHSDITSFLGATIAGFSTIIFNIAKSQIDQKIESNLRSKQFFLQRLILLMKGKDSWEKDYNNTEIIKVGISVDSACIIPINDRDINSNLNSNAMGVSYRSAESIVNQGRRRSIV